MRPSCVETLLLAVLSPQSNPKILRRSCLPGRALLEGHVPPLPDKLVGGQGRGDKQKGVHGGDGLHGARGLGGRRLGLRRGMVREGVGVNKNSVGHSG